MQQEWVRHQLGQFRAVAEWYRDKAKPGDTMLVGWPEIVSFYSHLPDGYVLSSQNLSSSSLDELIKELRTRGVTYVACDSEYCKGPISPLGIIHKQSLLLLLVESAPDMLEVAWQAKIGSQEVTVYRFHPLKNPPDTGRYSLGR